MVLCVCKLTSNISPVFWFQQNFALDCGGWGGVFIFKMVCLDDFLEFNLLNAKTQVLSNRPYFQLTLDVSSTTQENSSFCFQYENSKL